MQLVIRLFGDLVTLIFLAVIVWHGSKLARLQHGVGMVSIDLPAALFDYSVPVCGTLMMLQTLRLMALRIRGKPMPQPIAGEI